MTPLFQKSEVFVKVNTKDYINQVDGGYTMSNISDVSEWVKIDEGYGDRYNLCQGNYFEKPIVTMSGAYRYKLVDGVVVECTPEEIARQEEANKPAPAPVEDSVWDELDAAYQEGVDSL